MDLKHLNVTVPLFRIINYKTWVLVMTKYKSTHAALKKCHLSVHGSTLTMISSNSTLLRCLYLAKRLRYPWLCGFARS